MPRTEKHSATSLPREATCNRRSWNQLVYVKWRPRLTSTYGLTPKITPYTEEPQLQMPPQMLRYLFALSRFFFAILSLHSFECLRMLFCICFAFCCRSVGGWGGAKHTIRRDSTFRFQKYNLAKQNRLFSICTLHHFAQNAILNDFA